MEWLVACDTLVKKECIDCGGSKIALNPLSDKPAAVVLAIEKKLAELESRIDHLDAEDDLEDIDEDELN
jgi:hypothetical protein